ncbi:MAG TPA: hypothetical protein ENN41_10270 [Sediminispirochaeta sp.]|nr:hypothetical protein [Sediminispirochaeta sp.]
MKRDIVIVSTNDWHGFWYQRQEFATRFAAEGHRVFFVNRIPQRIPRPGRIIRWLLSKRQSRRINNEVPAGVHLLSPFLLPPFRRLRPLNRRLWKRAWSKVPRPRDPVLITYQPTYNVLDLIDLVEASKLVYINTHNYDADPSCPRDLLTAEVEMVRRADLLLADSAYNAGRLERHLPKETDGEVCRAMPGVHYQRFAAAYRGDEARRRRHLAFFGGIGRHLDVELYNRLAEHYEVSFIGIVDAAVRDKISENIRVHPPVAPTELPLLLRDADIMTILYIPSDYVRGILPAKFFECLATGKPLLVSGLEEAGPYRDLVYEVDGSFERAVELIKELPATETAERLERRREVALGADWGQRYRDLYRRIFGS